MSKYIYPHLIKYILGKSWILRDWASQYFWGGKKKKTKKTQNTKPPQIFYNQPT